MKRALLVALLVAPSPAFADRLSVKEARSALHRVEQRAKSQDYITSYRIGPCHRVAPRRVRCRVVDRWSTLRFGPSPATVISRKGGLVVRWPNGFEEPVR